MSPGDVTHTGQPGPDSKRTADGSAARMPLRAMACVWVPHTSMIRTGPSTCAAIRLISAWHARAS